MTIRNGSVKPKNEEVRYYPMKISGKWWKITDSFVDNHPGGQVIKEYFNMDATDIYDAFHEGSVVVDKYLKLLKEVPEEEAKRLDKEMEIREDQEATNVSAYEFSPEREQKMIESFNDLKKEIEAKGLMEANHMYFVFKSISTLSILFFALYLQYYEWYYLAAIVQGLAWQQFGWLTHEFCHQQPTKNRHLNDVISLFFGNVLQGFSRDWWKDKHNTHHAATNVIDHDGDINLAPLFAFIEGDLRKYINGFELFILNFIPLQHYYFTLMLPVLRFSWTSQSVFFVLSENSSNFKVYRKNALAEQSTILLHWILVFLQLYLLPTWSIRIGFFLVSQLLGGFLIGHVVTFNHNSVNKYPKDSRILNNFAALQILTTRNMTPSPFIDWLWGGLNYQVEHHLFPTMPRNNLNTVSHMVKKFCADNDLEYLVDDFFVGYGKNLEQLKNIAHIAVEERRKFEKKYQ